MERAIEWHDSSILDGDLLGTMTITDKGIRVRLPRDEAPEGWFDKRVVVGFAPGKIAIRAVDGRHGFRVQLRGIVRMWSVHIGNARLVEQAKKYGFRVGDELEASWDAEQGMIIGKVKGEGKYGQAE